MVEFVRIGTAKDCVGCVHNEKDFAREDRNGRPYKVVCKIGQKAKTCSVLDEYEKQEEERRDRRVGRI